jgi:hypothetical protein
MSDRGIVVVVSGVAAIAYAIVVARLRARRVRSYRAQFLPEVRDFLRAGSTYRVVLSSGTVLDNLRFVGTTQAAVPSGSSLRWLMTDWLAFARPDGRRLFLRPRTMKYYEEGDVATTYDVD